MSNHDFPVRFLRIFASLEQEGGCPLSYELRVRLFTAMPWRHEKRSRQKTDARDEERYWSRLYSAATVLHDLIINDKASEFHIVEMLNDGLVLHLSSGADADQSTEWLVEACLTHSPRLVLPVIESIARTAAGQRDFVVDRAEQRGVGAKSKLRHDNCIQEVYEQARLDFATANGRSARNHIRRFRRALGVHLTTEMVGSSIDGFANRAARRKKTGRSEMKTA